MVLGLVSYSTITSGLIHFLKACIWITYTRNARYIKQWLHSLDTLFSCTVLILNITFSHFVYVYFVMSLNLLLLILLCFWCVRLNFHSGWKKTISSSNVIPFVFPPTDGTISGQTPVKGGSLRRHPWKWAEWGVPLEGAAGVPAGHVRLVLPDDGAGEPPGRGRVQAIHGDGHEPLLHRHPAQVHNIPSPITIAELSRKQRYVNACMLSSQTTNIHCNVHVQYIILTIVSKNGFRTENLSAGSHDNPWPPLVYLPLCLRCFSSVLLILMPAVLRERRPPRTRWHGPRRWTACWGRRAARRPWIWSVTCTTPPPTWASASWLTSPIG